MVGERPVTVTTFHRFKRYAARLLTSTVNRKARVVAIWLSMLASTVPAVAQDSATLITNARIFDGRSEKLITGSSVLIEGKTISDVGPGLTAPPGAKVIDANGKVLMPGLTDAHWHSVLSDVSLKTMLGADIGYLNLVGAKALHNVLMRGFTTVRDTGGPALGLKRAIDEGVIAGPRIYPSGAMLSQTSGHGDFRSQWEVPAEPGSITRFELMGVSMIADGVPEVRKRTREVLMQGATQIKAHAGGGVSSDHDPLDVRQYSLEELRAIVDAADAWNTYVTVHAYTPKAIATAIEAGVKCIEHGQLMDESTAKLMARQGTWLSIQPFLGFDQKYLFPQGSENRRKQDAMMQGTERAYSLAKKYKVKTAFGTDLLFSSELSAKHGQQLVKLTRWFEPWEILRMATSTNHELFKLSGPRDPYPGKNGIVEPGAYADLILVDGNPLENLELVTDPESNFVLIMKDGVIYKDTM